MAERRRCCLCACTWQSAAGAACVHAHGRASPVLPVCMRMAERRRCCLCACAWQSATSGGADVSASWSAAGGVYVSVSRSAAGGVHASVSWGATGGVDVSVSWNAAGQCECELVLEHRRAVCL
eukprot:365778-Chlamydomonas_euryale.AAC.22